MSDAIAFAESAAALRRGPDAGQLLAALHLLAGDFAAAWSCYRAKSSWPSQAFLTPRVVS
jgi:hypothetical protein